VLLTNFALDHRGGSDLYVRDVAQALLARGHEPVVFSPRLGTVADDLRAATVTVVDDLRDLDTAPDVIHGQHHVPTMTALLRYPRTPAVFFCHGWLPWEEKPPRFPRILRYVAVDHACRERVTLEAGIPESAVEVILNFVDLRRFRERPPLPARPARALVFSNQASEATHLPAIREACRVRGISVDVAGRDSGRVAVRPEDVLPGYDLVFAKARCAIEALATGAAVVACDANGLGPLVTTRNLETLRCLNFGFRTLRQPVTPEAVGRAVDEYDDTDAARVTREMRRTAGLDEAMGRIVAVYDSAIAAARDPSFAADPVEESRAASRYLHGLGREITATGEIGRQNVSLLAQMDRLAHDAAGLASETGAQRVRLQDLEAARAEYDWMRESATWRARAAVLGWPGVKTLYRALSRATR
jgi:glycosyltransferase involved in cell wall biosynthesis